MHRKFDTYIEVKYWMEDMPIKLLKYWNIQEIITFLLLWAF